jgi:glycerol-3-phosphate acyltransferase PlsY
MAVPLLLALVVGYLLGSLPFGYLVARSKGVNIFEVGSKNPGATNVRRVLGPGPGNLVLALDALKGALAASWALARYSPAVMTIQFDGSLAGLSSQVKGDAWTTVGLAGLLGALLGHSFSCFTKFRGGKGVATGAGGFIVVFPSGALIALAIWGLMAAIFRYVSAASMAAAASLPVSAWFLHAGPVMLTASAVVAVFVVIRHRANISRLMAGTESRIGQKNNVSKS